MPTATNGKLVDRLFRCRSAERMKELHDDTVTLTVTSPPYWNAIDYDRHSADNSQDYRTRGYTKGFADYEDYLALLDRVFAEVLRVTRPGGFCAIVIGTVLEKGAHIPVPFHVTNRLCKLGWDFHQDIIWHKCTAGVKRAGVFIQKPFPGYFYPNIMTEYILIFRKPGEPLFRQVDAATKERSRLPVNGLFTMETANNVWHIAPVPPGQVDHPCPYPEEIPYRLIGLYSYSGDLVLDPFLGSGQTTKVAHALGRRAAAYDIERRYIDLSKKRLAEPLAIRPLQLFAKFEKMSLDAPLQGKTPPGATRHGSGRRRQNGKSDEVLFST